MKLRVKIDEDQEMTSDEPGVPGATHYLVDPNGDTLIEVEDNLHMFWISDGCPAIAELRVSKLITEEQEAELEAKYGYTGLLTYAKLHNYKQITEWAEDVNVIEGIYIFD